MSYEGLMGSFPRTYVTVVRSTNERASEKESLLQLTRMKGINKGNSYTPVTAPGFFGAITRPFELCYQKFFWHRAGRVILELILPLYILKRATRLQERFFT